MVCLATPLSRLFRRFAGLLFALYSSSTEAALGWMGMVHRLWRTASYFVSPLSLAWMNDSSITRHIGKAGVFFRRMESVLQASIAEYFVLYICYLLRMCETDYTNNFYIQSEAVIAR